MTAGSPSLNVPMMPVQFKKPYNSVHDSVLYNKGDDGCCCRYSPFDNSPS